jgi:hypothetical protein
LSEVESATSDDEVIIAQEQDAVNKPIHMGLSLKEVEGTLVLTSKRLIFACGDEKVTSLTHDVKNDKTTVRKLEDEAGNAALDFEGLGGALFYSEIEDLKRIKPNPHNLFLSLASINAVVGEKEHLLRRPTLKVSWNESNGNSKSTEFQEILTGESREKNLNDWAKVIEQLKAGTIKIQRLPSAPPIDTLEGRVAFMMGDMQDKGLLEIEEQVEQAFGVELEPDEVEAACKKLASIGFLDKGDDDDIDEFYRKRSPIGIGGLSS